MFEKLRSRLHGMSHSYVIHLFGDGKCNSKCLWCIRQYPLYKNCTVGTITKHQFEHFLYLNRNCKRPLVPYGLGEPTIHKEFVPFLTMALQEGWSLESIHTNLASPQVDHEVLKLLLWFRNITVNIGGATEETQRTNMGTSLCDSLINLRRLIMLKKRFRSNVRVSVKMVVNRHNVHEVDGLRGLLQHFKIPDVKAKEYPLYFSVADGSEEEKVSFYLRNIIGFKFPMRETVSVNDGRVKVSSKLTRCYGITPTIHTNGLVTVCCRSRWYGGYVGNAFEKSMCEIMASRQWKRAVKKALRREYVEYCKYCS